MKKLLILSTALLALGSATALAQGIVVNKTDGSKVYFNATEVESVTTFGYEEEDQQDDLTFTIGNVSFTMVPVEGGTFLMGSEADDAYTDEQPVHQVTVSSFSIGQTEVTQALWYAVMGEKPTNGGSQWTSDKGLNDNSPAYLISWDDCQEFIAKLNQLTGKEFRLPTEAEWEYAARGGAQSQGYTFSGSNSADEVAWYNLLSMTDDAISKGVRNVATKKANELQIYDMSGNVWEWCSDWYGFYASEAQTNPTGAEVGSYRVLRGGGWSNPNSRACRVTNRGYFNPSDYSDYTGLRLAL